MKTEDNLIPAFPSLNLPPYNVRIRTEGQRKEIFDRLRKKYIFLTPEEWVRQHIVNYLITQKQFPESLMTVEKGLKYNTLQKRGDIFIYNNFGKPLMIVECKASEVKITQSAFDQIARYNAVLKVKYLLVTNGINHYCCLMNYDTSSYSFLSEIPSYKELIESIA